MDKRLERRILEGTLRTNHPEVILDIRLWPAVVRLLRSAKDPAGSALAFTIEHQIIDQLENEHDEDQNA